MPSTKVSSLADIAADIKGTDLIYVAKDTGGGFSSVKADFSRISFRAVGTAFVGGGQTGNARGNNALDVQNQRGAVTQVSSGSGSVSFGNRLTASGQQSCALGYNSIGSGYRSISVGYKNTSSGSKSSALGYSCQSTNTKSSVFGYGCTASGSTSSVFGYKSTASQSSAVAVGWKCTASAQYAVAFGENSTASGLSSFAIGFNAKSRIDTTINICPAIINQKGVAAGTPDPDTWFTRSGVEVVLMSKELDFTAASYEGINIPGGSAFFPDEFGVIVTAATNVTVQPTVSSSYVLASTPTTGLTASGYRQRFTTLVSSNAHTTLVAYVDVAATADVMKGRFYWKGLFVENQ